MLQAGDHAGFTLETLGEGGVFGILPGKDFDRYVAANRGLEGFVDGRHPAVAYRIDQVKFGKTLWFHV